MENTPLVAEPPVEAKSHVHKDSGKHPNDEKKDKKVTSEPHP